VDADERPGETEDADDRPRGAALRAARRSLPRGLLEAAVGRARGCLERLARWPDPAPLSEHFASLAELLDVLGWSDRAGTAGTRERIDALRADLGRALRVSFEDFVQLLARELRDVGVDALGGAGGGVRVLSVIEARAHTFEHLFVLGLNRDLFPRRVSEDPLLPDALRRALAAVLPDVPVKARGFDEERYLFAQLVSGAPSVALSWQALSDDGKEKTASPLVEGLVQAAGGSVALAPSLFAAPARDAAAPRPAFEHAIQAGLYGTTAEFEAAFALALDEARHELPGGRVPAASADLAQVRVAILDEMDASPRRAGLGPWLGFVGALGGDADPRHGPLFVTALEHLARCPWRSFLERILRIEAVPDALGELPAASPLLVGNLVHRTLERIVEDALGETPRDLAVLAGAAGRDVPWPAPERLDAILHEEARDVLREGGIALPGFERLLVAAAAPGVQRVRELEWGSAEVLRGVLGCEVEGEVEVRDARGRARRVRFRADRADAGLRLTDYKTGKDPSDGQKKEESRRKKLLEGVGAGTWLQAPAYAFSGAGVALGRYLFAKADLPEEAAELAVARDDAEVREAFGGSVAALLGAFDLGSFFPRLVTPDGSREPRTCEQWCAVSEACVRGDSATRRRLLRFVEDARSGKRERLDDAERALLAVFDLGRVER
jgi:RecB family exonuclease